VNDIDPNYVIREMFDKAPFNQALRCWMNWLKKDSVPFHIDIHGKFNREEDRFIDLGTVSMGQEFKELY